MKLLIALSVLLSSMAQAQTPAAVDPALFHTTGFFRLSNGDFETVSAQTWSFEIRDPVTGKQILDPLTGKPKVEAGQSFIYDARNPLAKIAVSGANYAVLTDKSMIVFSSTWDKPIPKGKLQFEVDTYGGTFLVKKGTRELVTVSATGYVNFFTGVTAPAIRVVGGNYFVDADNDLWTIDAKGMVYHLTAGKYPLAYLPGGNYFYQQDGTIITIGSNGLPQPAYALSAKPTSLGGNYFIGEDSMIYTVGYNGNFYKNGSALGKIKHLGYSYAIFDNAQFVAVDGLGVVHVDAVRVTSTKTKFVKVTQIKDMIDPLSVYTPNTRKN